MLTGEEILLRAGDVFYFPTGMCYHSYWYGDETDEQCRVEWDSVGFTHFPDDASRHYAPQLLHPDEEGMVLLERLMAQPLDALTGSGWLYLFLGHMRPDMVESRADAKQQQLARIRYYISQDPSCTVPELAERCGMSQSSLYALFRTHSDISISELKNQVRVEQAAELLVTTDLSIEEMTVIADSSMLSVTVIFTISPRASSVGFGSVKTL